MHQIDAKLHQITAQIDAGNRTIPRYARAGLFEEVRLRLDRFVAFGFYRGRGRDHGGTIRRAIAGHR